MPLTLFKKRSRRTALSLRSQKWKLLLQVTMITDSRIESPPTQNLRPHAEAGLWLAPLPVMRPGLQNPFKQLEAAKCHRAGGSKASMMKTVGTRAPVTRSQMDRRLGRGRVNGTAKLARREDASEAADTAERPRSLSHTPTPARCKGPQTAANRTGRSNPAQFSAITRTCWRSREESN